MHTIEGNASDQIIRHSYSYSNPEIRGYIAASGVTAVANLAAQPAVLYNASNKNIEIYANTGSIAEKFWNANGGWSNWFGMGGNNITGSPTAVYNAGNANVEVYANAGGHLVENYWDPTWLTILGSGPA